MTLAHTTSDTTDARRSSAGPGHPTPTPLPVARTACACGASAFGQPPSLCLTHALEAERCQAQRMLTLARRGITQACRLAARYPHNPTLRREAGQWLAEAQDDLRGHAPSRPAGPSAVLTQRPGSLSGREVTPLRAHHARIPPSDHPGEEQSCAALPI